MGILGSSRIPISYDYRQPAQLPGLHADLARQAFAEPFRQQHHGELHLRRAGRAQQQNCKRRNHHLQLQRQPAHGASAGQRHEPGEAAVLLRCQRTAYFRQLQRHGVLLFAQWADGYCRPYGRKRKPCGRIYLRCMGQADLHHRHLGKHVGCR